MRSAERYNGKQTMTSKTHLELGQLGEKLVAHWLKGQGWTIMVQRWHCRWGELDLVAANSETLAFVEVKTRRDKNWDLNGLLAITSKKQEKLLKSAALFLSAHPELERLNCRFDVALVQTARGQSDLVAQGNLQKGMDGPTLNYGPYSLCLHQYIESAFET